MEATNVAYSQIARTLFKHWSFISNTSVNKKFIDVDGTTSIWNSVQSVR